MSDRSRSPRPARKTRRRPRRAQPADPSKRLTARQIRFLEELSLDPKDQTKAAVRAGYSARSATQMASDLLNAPRYAHVQARWQAMVSTRAAKIEITAEKVLQRVAMIAFGDVRQLARWRLEKEVVLRGRRFLEDGESQDEEEEQEQPPLVREVMRMRLIPSDELTDEAAAMIAEVKEAVYEYGSTVSVRPHNALEALKLLMRHLGLLKDRIQLEDFTAAGQEVAELLEDMAAAVSEQDEILRLAQAALNEPADKQPGKAREGQGETPA